MAAIIARHLDRAGLVVDGIADTGDAALRQARTGTADAAVIDVMIPHPDGLEVCRHLRHRGWRGPIIVISARADPASAGHALAAGADAFLGKPFPLSTLTDRLIDLLGRTAGTLGT
jgi:two-component system OmpR family response regulator